MKKYEIMYILKADLDDAARKSEMEKIHGLLTKNGAKITKTDEWGVKPFAYPINKEVKGYYVVIKIECESIDATKEFDRLNKIDNNVLRTLTVVDED